MSKLFSPLDSVYWSELRYDEGGRYVICSHKQGTQGFMSWTPEGFNARTRVHEYGGGAFLVYNGRVYFSNFQDQDMYTQGSDGDVPQRVTAEGTHWRYADGQFSEKVITPQPLYNTIVGVHIINRVS